MDDVENKVDKRQFGNMEGSRGKGLSPAHFPVSLVYVQQWVVKSSQCGNGAVVLTDFSGEFDLLDHTILIEKNDPHRNPKIYRSLDL